MKGIAKVLYGVFSRVSWLIFVISLVMINLDWYFYGEDRHEFIVVARIIWVFLPLLLHIAALLLALVTLKGNETTSYAVLQYSILGKFAIFYCVLQVLVFLPVCLLPNQWLLTQVYEFLLIPAVLLLNWQCWESVKLALDRTYRIG